MHTYSWCATILTISSRSLRHASSLLILCQLQPMQRRHTCKLYIALDSHIFSSDCMN